MELNRKELKKMSHSFNTIANRIMRVTYDEYSMILKKFLAFIEANEIIMEYICAGKTEEYDAKEDWDLVVNKDGYMFNFGPTAEEESFQIYCLLKYISENVANPVYSFHSIYRHSKWQDNVKEFNDRVVLVLINNVNDYLTRVGIDMGLDENTTWNVSGGQVNVASGHAVINATQNNGVEISEMENLIKQIMESVGSLEKDDAETIVDSIEMIRDELQKPEPKGKIISNGIKLLSPMISIANGIPTLVGHIQKFIDMVTPYIH